MNNKVAQQIDWFTRHGWLCGQKISKGIVYIQRGTIYKEFPTIEQAQQWIQQRESEFVARKHLDWINGEN